MPRIEQVLAFCAEEPVERVFLEDVARRGLGRFVAVERDDGALASLCHTGANVVPSGTAVGSWSGLTVRMLDNGLNQDNCKGVTITIDYTANP